MIVGMPMRDYNGTQMVDYHMISVEGRLHPPGDLIPNFEVEDEVDLGKRVRIYPEYGLSIPVRSEMGPVVVRVRVGTPGPHADIGDSTPEHSWTSKEPVDMGTAEIGLTSAAMPGDVFNNIQLPSRCVNAHIAWVYTPGGPPESYDQYTETLFISFW